jgi:hypothetical protein
MPLLRHDFAVSQVLKCSPPATTTTTTTTTIVEKGRRSNGNYAQV